MHRYQTNFPDGKNVQPILQKLLKLSMVYQIQAFWILLLVWLTILFVSIVTWMLD